jgi:hypothetical protein
MRKIELLLGFLVIIISACQKGETTPNRSPNGGRLTSVSVYSGSISLQQPPTFSIAYLYNYDADSNLVEITVRQTSTTVPRNIDSLFWNQTSQLIKYKKYRYYPTSSSYDPQYTDFSIHYSSGTNQVAYAKINLVVNGLIVATDSAYFRYRNNNVSAILIYKKGYADSIYLLTRKYEYNYSSNGELLESIRYLAPSIRNNEQSMSLGTSAKYSKFDLTRKYYHDFSFIEMWCYRYFDSRSDGDADWHLNTYSKYNYNNFTIGGDSSFTNFFSYYSSNQRPDSTISINADSTQKYKYVFAYQ